MSATLLRLARARGLVPRVLLPAALLLPFAQAGQEPNAPFELHPPAPVDAELVGPLAGWEQLSCAACHATIAEEWAGSLHALSWVDPRYQAKLRTRRRRASCTGCHVPEPLHQAASPDQAASLGRPPVARADEREAHRFGVSCKTCHLAPEGVILGPYGLETDAHRTRRSERFVAPGVNALCATCHGTTIGPVIGLADDLPPGRSCVECHMAPLVRSIATDDEDRPLPPRAGRSHALQTPRDPAFLAQAFAVSVTAEGDELVVRIENRAGHRVPGLEGRRLVFTAEDADLARPRPLAELELDTRAYLPVGGSRTLRFPRGPAGPERLRIRGEHHAPGARSAVPFLERVFRSPGLEEQGVAPSVRPGS